MGMVEMNRAARLPVAPPTSDIESLEIRSLENGFEVTCRNKQPASQGDKAMPYESPKVYAFTGADEALAFAAKKLKGDNTDAYGEGAPAAEPTPAAPVADDTDAGE